MAIETGTKALLPDANRLLVSTDVNTCFGDRETSQGLLGVGRPPLCHPVACWVNSVNQFYNSSLTAGP
jgi:hypothetical protein